MSVPFLVLDEISKVYGVGDTAVRAADAISLTVERGELVALMGTSGPASRRCSPSPED